jgi:putrescine aminotransferase
MADKLIADGGEFYHGFTCSGHPVPAAVALENIRICKAEKVVERVRDDIGPYFQARLRETLGDHPLVGHIEGIGLIAGIALMEDKKNKVFFDDTRDVGAICREHCLENGLIMRAVGNRMVTSPPLIISRKEVDELCATARKSLDLTLESL